MSDIETNQISIYKPETHENDDAQTAADNKEILSKIPFAVVGADTEITVNKEVIRGRQYPWGIINIENEDHCDFVALRKMLIRTNMEELKQYTNDELYENYRLIKISATASDVRAPVAHAPSTKLEQDRSAHDQKMQKMEMEMKAVFQQKVAEKEAKLKQSEDEVFSPYLVVRPPSRDERSARATASRAR